MQPQPISPVIIKVIEQPTPEMGVADVFLKVIVLTGAFILLAILAGLLVGGLLIAFKRLRPDHTVNGQAGDRVRLGLGPTNFPLFSASDRACAGQSTRTVTRDAVASSNIVAAGNRSPS